MHLPAPKRHSGADVLDGGIGNDTLNYSASLVGVIVDLDAGTASGGDADGDTIAGFENVIGSAHDDTITGDELANNLSGGAGNDTIDGGLGNDVINGGAGADDLDGGGDIDTLSYAGSSAGVTVDLSVPSASGGDADGDVIAGFENVTGSAHADTLTGDGGANVIAGGAGADVLAGAGGADTISDGTGADTIIGGDGADLINLANDGTTDLIDYNAISEAGDSITGFNAGAVPGPGDQFDVQDLLTGFAGATLADAVLGGFVTFADSGAGGTLVQVDGDGLGDSFTTVATLEAIGFVDIATSEALLADNIIVT